MVQIPFPEGYKPKRRHNKQKSKIKKDKERPISPSLNKKDMKKLLNSHRNRKKQPAEKFFEDIVWGDVKSPTKFDKYIVTGKIVEVEVYERTLTAQLAKASTYICRQARRWYEEEIVDDIAEWYKRWEQHPFTSRLAAIEKPYKDADYILTYMNMTALRDNLKDGYKEMLRVANQCDRERIDYRGDLPTAPIRKFKAAAAEFYEVVNAVCIKSNAELNKLTKPAKGSKVGDIKKKQKTPSKKDFSFSKGQAFYKGKDLGLPTGAELSCVEILKKLANSLGKVVEYKTLDKNSQPSEASVFLRGKIRTIRSALKKHKVPYEIGSKKWIGYVLSKS